MSKATSKNVTILEALKLQGEKSSAVEKYYSYLTMLKQLTDKFEAV